jgi:hypothetical protein
MTSAQTTQAAASAEAGFFQFTYMGHELTVRNGKLVTYKGETRWIWQLPTTMRNDMEIAYGRAQRQAA